MYFIKNNDTAFYYRSKRAMTFAFAVSYKLQYNVAFSNNLPISNVYNSETHVSAESVTVPPHSSIVVSLIALYKQEYIAVVNIQ